MSITTPRAARPEIRSAAALVAPDVFGLTTGIVNLAMIGQEGSGEQGWTLIDTGFTGFASKILHWAAERFTPEGETPDPDHPPAPAAILLTHGHFDHIGTLHSLLKVWPDTPVYAHPRELPYLTGKSPYPPPDTTTGGGLMSRTSSLFPGGPFDFRPHIQPLSIDYVPTLPDWDLIETPGHSPGHVSFFRPEDGVLVAGDAFVTTRQESIYSALTQRFAPQGPPWYYTPDFSAARESIETLWKLKPSVALTGHGPIVEGETLARTLSMIRRDWSKPGMTPAKGRYLRTPAITDLDGIVWLPPKPIDWVGIGMAVGAGLALAGAIAALTRLPATSRAYNRNGG